MTFFSFFMDNKSGWKTNEKKLSKKEPNIYQEIKKFSELNSLSNLSFKEQVWHFIHKYTDIPKCVECGKKLKFKRSLREGYGKYCSLTCTNMNLEHINQSKETRLLKKSEIIEKTIKTNLEKYGVENTFQRTDLVRNGFLRNHGVDHVSKISGVKEKRERTFLDRYGYPNNFVIFKNRDKNKTIKQNNFIFKYDKYDFKNHKGDLLTVKCGICSSDYDINRSLFRYRSMNEISPCTICNPINSSDSYKEKELVSFIKSICDDEILENDRSLINPKELDVYIPKLKLAIEFNGLYWHSSEFTDMKYHLNKTKSCNEKDVELIHIFEDEWLYKRNIVESILKTKFNIYDRVIFGRKCVIKEIDSKNYKNFCNKNHIQGSVNSSVKLGLFYENELVSVMSFGQLRKSLGSNKKEGIYEMLRFCSKLNTLVIGGASKLFKFFVEKYNPIEIISFSDKRYFNGNLYEKLGFNLLCETSPNYFYFSGDLKRENRFKYRKDVLVSDGYDKNKSETEIMKERGFYKIWDCGNKKWVWNQKTHEKNTSIIPNQNIYN